jgi:hypothetical protein
MRHSKIYGDNSRVTPEKISRLFTVIRPNNIYIFLQRNARKICIIHCVTPEKYRDNST